MAKPAPWMGWLRGDELIVLSVWHSTRGKGPALCVCAIDMKFQARVIPSGNATAVVVPTSAKAALGSDARPLVAVAINGHSWRSRVALMRGQCLIGISAANRAASGIAEGDLVEVALELDTAPGVVPEPADLAAELNKTPEARAAFDRLPFGLKRKHVMAIEDAKSAETRQRRVLKLVADLRQTAA